MTRDDALRTLTEVLAGIAPDVDLADLPSDADLRTEADLDSMDFLALVEGVAAATGVEVPEADYPRVRTVDGWLAYLTP